MYSAVARALQNKRAGHDSHSTEVATLELEHTFTWLFWRCWWQALFSVMDAPVAFVPCGMRAFSFSVRPSAWLYQLPETRPWHAAQTPPKYQIEISAQWEAMFWVDNKYWRAADSLWSASIFHRIIIVFDTRNWAVHLVCYVTWNGTSRQNNFSNSTMLFAGRLLTQVFACEWSEWLWSLTTPRYSTAI